MTDLDPAVVEPISDEMLELVGRDHPNPWGSVDDPYCPICSLIARLDAAEAERDVLREAAKNLAAMWEQVQEVWARSTSNDEEVEEAESLFYAAVRDCAALSEHQEER